MKHKVDWFCMKCWQEGSVELERHPADNVSEIPEVQVQHREMWRRVEGGGHCDVPDIRKPESPVKPRVKRDKGPLLPDVGEPIKIR